MRPGIKRSLTGTILEFLAAMSTLYMKPDLKIH